MAWATPHTYVDGDVVNAANLNEVRDNLRYLKGLDGVPYIDAALELPEIATPATPGAGMDLRTYGIGAQILADLGVHAMELLTPTHSNIVGLEGYGLSVVGERSIPGEA